MSVLRWWNRYWFKPAPLLHLGIARIVIVGFQLVYLLLWRPDRGEFVALAKYPDAMYNPVWLIKILSLPMGMHWRPPLEFLELLYWLTVATGALALIGLFTNPSLLLFGAGSTFMRGYAYSFGEFHHPEALMMISLTILALSPAGEVLSLDDLRRRMAQAFRNRKFVSFDLAAATSAYARWPLLLIQWMFALIYFSASFSKLSKSGLTWMNGYTLQYYLFHDGTRWGSKLGLWFAKQHVLCQLLQWQTVLFQGTFFLVLIFPMLAWIYVPIGAVFHSVIYITARAPFFQYLAIYVVFIQWIPIARALNRRWGRGEAVARPEILFDGQCPLCIRSMTFFRYFDWRNRLRYIDLESGKSTLLPRHKDIRVEDCRREMHLLLPDGRVFRGFFAFRRLCFMLPSLWPLLVLLYFPLAGRVGPVVYRIIAANRRRIFPCDTGNCAIH